MNAQSKQSHAIEELAKLIMHWQKEGLKHPEKFFELQQKYYHLSLQIFENMQEDYETYRQSVIDRIMELAKTSIKDERQLENLDIFLDNFIVSPYRLMSLLGAQNK